MSQFLTPPTFEDIYRLLRAWRLWLLGALLGALLGMAVYALFPPEYRARATVMIDFNVEQSWAEIPDREVFYFLEREARKLVELAWADDTLQAVSDKIGVDVPTLRARALTLSHPSDGGWHFYATDAEALVAVKLASAWATAFTDNTLTGIQTAVELDAARKALEANPDEPALKDKIAALEAQSLGITPALQISPAQIQNLPVSRKTGLGTYVLSGAAIFLVVSSFLFLLFPRKKEHAA